MEPRAVQYAKAGDGVDIAFTVAGEGSPIVVVPNAPFSHLQLGEKNPLAVPYRRLDSRHRVIRYDCGGSGLSDREASDYSLEAERLDLEAVVARAGAERFALWASVHLGTVAIDYAARWPDRVTHLILFDAYARGADFLRPPELRAMGRLIDRDWDLWTETTAHAFLGWQDAEEARQLAEFMRQSVTQQAAREFYAAARTYDVSSVLPQVRAPALVLHYTRVRWPDVSIARGLASAIPSARLVVYEDHESALRAAEEFLGGAPPDVSHAEAEQLRSGTAIILFADIAGSTELTERLGDAAFREKARELDEALRRAISSNGGTPIEGKLLGDGVLATFASAKDAIEAAVACRDQGRHAGLPLHLGLHAGDVIREESNVFGGAVNIASRISGLAAPGEVLVSQTVRDLARTSAGVSFEDRGERSLKGVGEPVRLFAVVAG